MQPTSLQSTVPGMTGSNDASAIQAQIQQLESQLATLRSQLSGAQQPVQNTTVSSLMTPAIAPVTTQSYGANYAPAQGSTNMVQAPSQSQIGPNGLPVGFDSREIAKLWAYSDKNLKQNTKPASNMDVGHFLTKGC